MAASKQLYVLTKTAEDDFRAARRWSRQRWGTDLTRQYFQDLHDGATYIARNWQSLPTKDDLTDGADLGIHTVREHYILYVPSPEPGQIIIVALIRQTRDVPSILRANGFMIKRELKRIFDGQ